MGYYGGNQASGIPQAPYPSGTFQPAYNGYTSINANYQNQNGTQQQNTLTGQQSQFTPQQQAAQSQALSGLSGFVSGQSQVPAYMTAPPQVFQAYNDAFQKFVAPGIAAQYGAGSPQIGAQQSFGNEQLASNLYQQGVQNWLAGQAQLGNLAYTAVGQNQQQNMGNQFNQNTTNLGLTDTEFGQSLLSMLLGA